MVAGSWKAMLEMVKIKMLTEYRFPVRSRSDNIDVTEAELMTPESSRFKEQSMPAMEHKRRSIFRRSRRSRDSLAADASSSSGMIGAVSPSAGGALVVWSGIATVWRGDQGWNSDSHKC
jgi:hypothetical protein